MKFQRDALEGQFVVSSYDENGVVVNGTNHSESFVFGSDLAPQAWLPAYKKTLNIQMCEWLFAKCPDTLEVLLIGTGPKQVFPELEVRRFFAQKKCPVEYMDTLAACRTYNILLGEGRIVLAALIL